MWFISLLFVDTISIQKKRERPGFGSKTVRLETRDGQTEDRWTERQMKMKDSIKFMAIKIRGRHQNEKDADE